MAGVREYVGNVRGDVSSRRILVERRGPFLVSQEGGALSLGTKGRCLVKHRGELAADTREPYYFTENRPASPRTVPLHREPSRFIENRTTSPKDFVVDDPRAVDGKIDARCIIPCR